MKKLEVQFDVKLTLSGTLDVMEGDNVDQILEEAKEKIIKLYEDSNDYGYPKLNKILEIDENLLPKYHFFTITSIFDYDSEESQDLTDEQQSKCTRIRFP